MNVDAVRARYLPIYLLVSISACDRADKHGSANAGASTTAAIAASSAPLTLPSANAGATKWKYAFTAGESKIEFVGVQKSGKHEGSFSSFNGTVIVSNHDLERSSVSVDIDMPSLQTGDPKLTAWLKSPAFFDVVQYPRAHFASNSVRLGGELGATNTVAGILELHGVQKPLDIPATIHVRPDGVDVDAEVTLSRAAFGLTYQGKAKDLLDDKVVVNLSLTAKRVPEP